MAYVNFFDGTYVRGLVTGLHRTTAVITLDFWKSGRATFDLPPHRHRFRWRPLAHYMIQTSRNDWYLNDEMPLLVERLNFLTRRHDFVLALGFSMGGFGLSSVAASLDTDRIALISPRLPPKFSVCNVKKRSRGHTIAPTFLVFDPNFGDDAEHALVHRDFLSQVTVIELLGGGHPATNLIKTKGKFTGFLDALLAQECDPLAIERLHNNGRIPGAGGTNIHQTIQTPCPPTVSDRGLSKFLARRADRKSWSTSDGRPVNVAFECPPESSTR